MPTEAPVFLPAVNEKEVVGEFSWSNQKKYWANVFKHKLSVTAREKAGGLCVTGAPPLSTVSTDLVMSGPAVMQSQRH